MTMMTTVYDGLMTMSLKEKLTLFIFCFELAVVFLLPSLLGLLDALDDIKFSDPDWPLILGKDTELFRVLRKRTVKYL